VGDNSINLCRWCEFTNNNPSIKDYQSVRQNLHCTGTNTIVNVESLEGGYGA
jgi:hypothetical protein